MSVKVTKLRSAPVVDGDLTDWPWRPQVAVSQPAQVLAGAERWQGAADASCELQFGYDSNCLYVSGLVRDDELLPVRAGSAPLVGDGLELTFGLVGAGPDAPGSSEDLVVLLAPLSDTRPWTIVDPKTKAPRQGGSSLTGFVAAGRDLGEGSYQFEAAIPFHQLGSVRPGMTQMAVEVVLVDIDADGAPVRLSWSGLEPTAGALGGQLEFVGAGPLVSELPARLLTLEMLADLRYLLAPLGAALMLLLALRLWPRIAVRTQWLRPWILGAGVLVFVLGLSTPRLWDAWREQQQQAGLALQVDAVKGLVEKLEQGTLASYRGPSRDRALMDLLAGKPVARQRYTSYRYLSQIAPEEFGSAPRDYPDEPFQVRPYWIPLDGQRVETFQFDPPLVGEELYVVLGRPAFPPLLPLLPGADVVPQIEIERNQGTPGTRAETVAFEGIYAPAGSLSDEASEVDWVRIPLDRPLRTLGLRLQQGADVRLVGLTLLAKREEPAQPLILGTPSLDGVLTDLRGAYPRNAGFELGPGAKKRISLPAGGDPCNKLWLFCHAVYPGLPTANPGATVGEIVLRFRNDMPERVLVLEHQVSMFYELVVHNTRDQPPEGSPAVIAYSWADEQKERHINMALPVLDLPAGSDLESIEFRNHADYRIRFRSVVFGNEKAAAPQDPEDSPLLREGQDVRLPQDVRQALAAAEISIYRDGRLSESTVSAEARQDAGLLPRDAALHAEPAKPLRTLTKAGGERAAVYVPLAGDGWDGAVLNVAVVDQNRPQAAVFASRMGLLLCLAGAPLLLVLLSELLAAVANLRARLMAVLSAAVLAPLVVLSIVLAQVLDRGHVTDQEEGMLRQVQNASAQLSEQKERLRGSAQQWLQDLAQIYERRLGDAPLDDQASARVQAAMPSLRQLLVGQLPPEWKGGFLKLEWNPTPAGRAVEALSSVAGDLRLASAEAPARLEPGIYVHWGTVVIAVRSEQAVPGGTLALTAARPLGVDFLGALAPGASVMLCDPRGYPLQVAGSRIEPRALMAHGRDPLVMAERERALFAALDQRKPKVERSTSAYGDWLCGYEVLRDLQDTPRALFVLAQPDLPAALDLPIGRIPVRAFFLLVGGLLLVLSTFVAYVVSSRISRPIEQIERGAQLLATGELDARVPVTEVGQLGQLSRTFNKMAGDLQGRLFDLQKLNRAMRELSSQLDANHTLGVLRRFCEQHVLADRVRIVLFEPEATKVELHGGPEPERLDLAPVFSFLPMALGPFSLCRLPQQAGLVPLLPGIHSIVGVPMLVGGRCRGAVLLGFQSGRPPELDLQLLATVVAQAAVALDNAQLYRHAVQDPVTGAFAPDFFRRRVAEEVAAAQQRGTPLALLALGLGDGASRPRGLRRFAVVLRETLPKGALLCHAGAGQFQALAPQLDRSGGEALVLRVLEAWQRVVEMAQESDIEDRRPTSAVVVFPEEAASAEFLFEALRDRLASGSALAPAAVEVDASLRRAGVTAVSPAMREVYRTMRRVAPTDLAVLFLGETGSGKEVLTNLLHRWSRRAGGPLVKVHCAALSETLLASELFGHEKGAFTGADRRKVGKFEQANGGTIFLDEVGEIPLDVQVKLLRVLQEREVDRVGGADPVPIDVRVVAATNRDIEEMVRQGRFREDLYYRLQGIVVNVPPLRDRRQEIPALVEQFRSEVVASGESRVRGFATDAMDALFRRDWPGNIRELRNAVYRAMVLASGELVERQDVLAALPQPLPGAAASGRSRELPALPYEGEVGDTTPGPDAAARQGGGRPRGVGAPRRSGRTDEGESAPDVAPEAPVVLPSRPPEALPVALEPAAARAAGEAPGASRSFELPQLPPRVQALYQRLVAQGSLGTQDHMQQAGLSHRTSLRDFQALVDLGLAERIGSRRGARYRPTGGQ